MISTSICSRCKTSHVTGSTCYPLSIIKFKVTAKNWHFCRFRICTNIIFMFFTHIDSKCHAKMSKLCLRIKNLYTNWMLCLLVIVRPLKIIHFSTLLIWLSNKSKIWKLNNILVRTYNANKTYHQLQLN